MSNIMAISKIRKAYNFVQAQRERVQSTNTRILVITIFMYSLSYHMKRAVVYDLEEIRTNQEVTLVLNELNNIITVLLGVWSDRAVNRKLLVLLSIAGRFTVFNAILKKYLLSSSNMFQERILSVLTGDWAVFNVGVYSHVCELYNEKLRFFAIGSVSASMVAGKTVAIILKPERFVPDEYSVTFFICTALDVSSFLGAYIFIKDVPESVTKLNTNKNKGTLKSFLKYLKDLFRPNCKKCTFFSYKENSRRFKLILVIIIIFFQDGPDYDVGYLIGVYLIGHNVLDSEQGLHLRRLNNCTSILGISIIMLLRYRFKYQESILGIVSSVSDIFSHTILCILQPILGIYIATFLGMFSLSTYVCVRFISSKLVKNDELGKTFAMLEVAASLAASFHMNFNSVYAFYHPGLSVGSVFIFSWFYKKWMDEKKYLTKQNMMVFNEVLPFPLHANDTVTNDENEDFNESEI